MDHSWVNRVDILPNDFILYKSTACGLVTAKKWTNNNLVT